MFYYKNFVAYMKTEKKSS